jgi:hypothetical protein
MKGFARNVMIAFCVAWVSGANADPLKVVVSIENLSQPSNFEATLPNTAPTAFPLWYAFHDGSMDTFDTGSLASDEVAALAKEGIIIPLIERARSEHPSATVNMIANNHGGPDSVAEITNYRARAQVLDPARHTFFSFAAKLAPSDDAFLGNDEPTRFRVFDADGEFLGPIVIDVYGDEVLDAGVRENNETGTMYVDSRLPDLSQGVATSEPIARHPGYNGSLANPEGTPVGILGVLGEFCDVSRRSVDCFQLDTVKGDFTRPNYPIARIRITREVDASFSGAWHAPSLSGEGYTLMISGSPPTVSVGAYTYLPDGSGRQLWLFGQGPLDGTVARVPLMSTSNGVFASPQNPSMVQVSAWGEVRISFFSCNEILTTLHPTSPDYIGFGENRLIFLEKTIATGTGNERSCFSPALDTSRPDNSWPHPRDDVIVPQP